MKQGEETNSSPLLFGQLNELNVVMVRIEYKDLKQTLNLLDLLGMRNHTLLILTAFRTSMQKRKEIYLSKHFFLYIAGAN